MEPLTVVVYDRCNAGTARLDKGVRALSDAAKASGIELTLIPCSRLNPFPGERLAATEVLGDERFLVDAVVVNARGAHANEVLELARTRNVVVPTHIIYLDSGAGNGADDYQTVPVRGGNGHLTPADAVTVVGALSQWYRTSH